MKPKEYGRKEEIEMLKQIKNKNPQQDPLESIKRLLILQLLTIGVTDKIIARTLGVDSSTIRRLVSLKELRNVVGSKK